MYSDWLPIIKYAVGTKTSEESVFLFTNAFLALVRLQLIESGKVETT